MCDNIIMPVSNINMYNILNDIIIKQPIVLSMLNNF